MKRPRKSRDPLADIVVDMGAPADDPKHGPLLSRIQAHMGPASGKHYHAVWSACDGLVEAWEKLQFGQCHSTCPVAKWRDDTMTKAINNARKALGRKTSNE